MVKVVFREAQPLDFDKVAKLVTDADELYVISPKSHFPWTAEQVANIAQTREFNTVAIDKDSQIIIGYANMYNVTDKTAYIGNVIVHGEYRNQQIGEQLMQYMIAICQDKQVMPHVSVFNHNTGALRFYHRLGFVPFAMQEREFHQNKIMLIHCQYLENSKG